MCFLYRNNNNFNEVDFKKQNHFYNVTSSLRLLEKDYKVTHYSQSESNISGLILYNKYFIISSVLRLNKTVKRRVSRSKLLFINYFL